MKPTILFLYNSSLHAPQPWLDDGGYNCVSVDYDDTDHSKDRTQDSHKSHTRLNIDLGQPLAPQKINDALGALGLAMPSFILSFAPCTDMAVSGAAHFKTKGTRDPLFQIRATNDAKLVLAWDCPSIVENPVSVLATTWKKPTGYVHPYQFGHLLPSDDVHPEYPEYYPPQDRYNKKTGLWCSNGARMPLGIIGDNAPLGDANPCHLKLGGKSARTKYIRSLTPRGMAIAIYQANKMGA